MDVRFSLNGMKSLCLASLFTITPCRRSSQYGVAMQPMANAMPDDIYLMSLEARLFAEGERQNVVLRLLNHRDSGTPQQVRRFNCWEVTANSQSPVGQLETNLQSICLHHGRIRREDSLSHPSGRTMRSVSLASREGANARSALRKDCCPPKLVYVCY